MENNGIGVAAETLLFIINRLYLAERTGRIKGLGMGYAIVRHAVEACGGSVLAKVRRMNVPFSSFHGRADVVSDGH